MENKPNSGRTNSTRAGASRANSGRTAGKNDSAKGGNTKMNKNEKRWIVLLVAVLVIAVVLIVGLSMSGNKQDTTIGQSQAQGATGTQAGDESSDYATRVNTNEDFNATKTYNDLEISNIQLSENNGTSVLLADVTNKGESTHEQETVKITIVGEDDSETTVNAIIGTIEPGETIKLNTSMTADVVNAKDFKIEAGE